MSWTKYQTNLLDNLNRLTVDTPDATLAPKELAIQSSRWSEKAAVFNYASMAYNNQFFFDGLHPDAPRPELGQKKEAIIPRELNADICNSFSSLDTLREEMLKTADAMFGPGFVWLVKDISGGGMMKILTTYIAGSPFPAAHARRQPVDMNTITTNVLANRNLTPSDHNRRLREVQNSVGFMGDHSNQSGREQLGPGAGQDLAPILCVKVWEHGWLYDYGYELNSKRIYLEQWWEAIDWNHAFQKTLERKSSTGLAGVSSHFRSSSAYSRL